jgi:hypothetical protein
LTEDDRTVRASFREQARHCLDLGSPFTAMLCTLLAERLSTTTRFGARILGWPGEPVADALPLRAAGALHALARSGTASGLARAYPPHSVDADALWRAVDAAAQDHDGFLHDWLDSPPQTNEVARSAAILGGCLAIAARTGLPLSLLEIGASAGLNLGFEHYRYALGEAAWGGADAAVTIRCDWRGTPPPLDAPLRVVDRAGCDRQPLDPGSAADRDRLLAYVWADQQERLARTAAALDAARQAPWRIERADAADWLERRLSAPPLPGRARVLFHTIVWQYLPKSVTARVEAAARAAAATASRQAPLAWLRMEPDGGGPGAALDFRLWPGGEAIRLGRADYHGRWVDWAEGARGP